MRNCYRAVIAVILLVALNTPDAQSVTKEEVEAARIAAEQADQAWKEADIRREKVEKISARQYEAYMKAGDDSIEAVKALEKAKTKGDDAALIVAEKARREAAKRRDNASDEYESARAILNAAEFEAFNREHEVRITKECVEWRGIGIGGGIRRARRCCTQ